MVNLALNSIIDHSRFHRILELKAVNSQKTLCSSSFLQTFALNHCLLTFIHRKKYVDSDFVQQFVDMTKTISSEKNRLYGGLLSLGKTLQPFNAAVTLYLDSKLLMPVDCFAELV